MSKKVLRSTLSKVKPSDSVTAITNNKKSKKRYKNKYSSILRIPQKTSNAKNKKYKRK